MLKDGLNIIADAQWGSGGKGKICGYLAKTRKLSLASACNAPNAGHSTVDNGVRRVFKCLPSASLWCDRILLGAGSILNEERLLEEKSWLPADHLVFVHPRAVRLSPRHAEAEAELQAIASTRQGAGAALCDKIMRRPVLWGGDEAATRRLISTDGVWLHEVAQGFALSIDHGSHYPNCTSRNSSPQAALDSLGVPVKRLQSVGLIIRPFPIRVGNDGADSYSGGWYNDQSETTWQDVARQAGMNWDETTELIKREHTTVTKRPRRVATFSWEGILAAQAVCDPDYWVLNFAQYIDARATGEKNIKNLPPRVRIFIDEIEGKTGKPVALIGTGEDVMDMIENT